MTTGEVPQTLSLSVALTNHVRGRLAGPRAIIAGVDRISDGWETEVHSCVLVDADAGRREDWIVRAYPGQYADYKANAEYQTLAMLAGAGYPVPCVHALELDSGVLGSPFILMERVAGGPVADAIHSAPMDTRLRLVGEFADLLWRLHSLDWRECARAAPGLRKPWTPDPGTDAGSFTRRWLVGQQAFFGRAGLHGLEPAFDWLVEHADAIGPARLALIHGDYHFRNVLYAPDGRQIVIDWTNAEVADARCDLAWALLLMGLYDGWAVRDTILAAYERASGGVVESLGYFEAYACARRLTSMLATAAHGAESFGMRAGATELIRRQVGHMEALYLLLIARIGSRLPMVEATLRDLRSEPG